MYMHCFGDSYHASDKVTSISHTGILIFCNQAPVMWMSKKHNSVETLTIRSEFIALKLAVDLVISLQYNLRIFGVPLEIPTDMFCENESLVSLCCTRNITALHIMNSDRLLPPSFVTLPRETPIPTWRIC